MCGSDGVSYGNECELRAESCRRGVAAPEVVSEGPCSPDGDLVIRPDNDDPCSDLTPCSKIFSPVCGHTGQSNVTFTNKCKLLQESCSSRTFIRTVHDGACHEEDNEVETDHEDMMERMGQCENTCTDDETGEDHVCGSDGRTYQDMCHLQRQACLTSSHLKLLHEGMTDVMKKKEKNLN